MDQDFQWGSPYLDPQALNARQGSISYYDFQWWENNNPAAPEADADADKTVPELPVKPEEAAENPDKADYDIIQE